MARFFVIKTQTGQIENIVELDADSESWTAPDGCHTAPANEQTIGDIYDENHIVPSGPPLFEQGGV